jgi:hypothetical protein
MPGSIAPHEHSAAEVSIGKDAVVRTRPIASRIEGYIGNQQAGLITEVP